MMSFVEYNFVVGVTDFCDYSEKNYIGYIYADGNMLSP
jgi:hypothetical protein